ncbi:MAG TPA: ABC transporter ATP-binding protein [Microbacteriaceae bacterium]|nr:ABC transporter ATP-binding protein [Microbacteriaceae bacterium]
MSAAVIDLQDVTVLRDERPILNHLSWHVTADQRWVIMGPNGAGKSTLLQIASASMFPSTGVVELLDERLGSVDLTELRPMIGYVSSSMARKLQRGETVLDTVLTAAYGVTGRWHEAYDSLDERRARRVLSEWKLDALADRAYGSLSDGEQKRVQIARAVMTDPELLLLDEPAVSLDLGAREEFIGLLGGFAQSQSSPALVLVTHHVEEIPNGFTHAMLLREGTVVASGAIDEVLTSANVSDTYGLTIELDQADGRYRARAR